MKRLIKDPFFHFLLIGALLFVIFEIFSAPQEGAEQITITQGDITALIGNFKRTWQRPPTSEELNKLIENKVLDEVAYREALAMGLDQDDLYIKRRLRMKLELLYEDLAGMVSASDTDLQSYYEQNRSAFSVDPRISFKQVYINTQTNRAKSEEQARLTLSQLNAAGSTADPFQFGDPSMLPGDVPLSSLSSIKRQFGQTFADQLQLTENGRWYGPLNSEYGLHLVFVREHVPGRVRDFAEVRDKVEREWSALQREQIKKEAFEKLREQYQVMIEPYQPAVATRDDADS